MWTNLIVHFARTDVGVKRSHNQDAFSVSLARTDAAWRRRGHLFVVADGMGAHAVGELASKMAVQSIEHTYPRLKMDDPKDALRTAIERANETIHEKGSQNPEFRGMGTTATSLVLLPQGAIVGHVGDSRCYRIRSNVIEQLSFDHSLQWELARQKHVSPEEMTHIPSNVIVRSLGPQAEVKTDTSGPYPILDGDRFLLCSDGLSGPVSDDEIWAVANHLPGDDACQFLVDLANLRGGLDNITLILVQAGDASKVNAAASAKPRISLRDRLKNVLSAVRSEWWYFLGGVGAASLGVFLYQQANWRLNACIFLGALGLLIVSLLTSVRRRRRLAEKQETAPPEGDQPIHRLRTCKLDRGLIENLAGAEQRLRELALEQTWRVDWADLTSNRTAAETALKADDVPGAFRHYCRAVSILSAGLRRFQDKHEVLIPQWDRYRK